MATVTTGIGGIQPIVIEQTSVARYTALSETAEGFTVTENEGDRHFEPISFPGVTEVAAVIYYRTRHTGLPRFTVRLNHETLTEFTFTDNDPPERCWHELIPATTAAGTPTLMEQNNESTRTTPVRR